MLVNFQDKATQPFTPATARSVMFDSVSNFDYENSYGQTWLTGDVAGWFTIPTSYTTCDTAAIAFYAKQAAAAAGYNLANYNRYVYTFPSAPCGGWSGMAYLGGNPSQAWINGAFSLSVVGHELGHNYGLYHSKSLDCGSQVIGAVGSGCTSSEYGDSFDIMGTGSRHFNAFGTLLTGSNGTVVFKYKFKRSDPVGSYLAVAASTVNGLSGNATTGFVVQ